MHENILTQQTDKTFERNQMNHIYHRINMYVIKHHQASNQKKSCNLELLLEKLSFRTYMYHQESPAWTWDQGKSYKMTKLTNFKGFSNSFSFLHLFKWINDSFRFWFSFHFTFFTFRKEHKTQEDTSAWRLPTKSRWSRKLTVEEVLVGLLVLCCNVCIDRSEVDSRLEQKLQRSSESDWTLQWSNYYLVP